MDLVGITIIFTFVAMIAAGAMALSAQQPPAHRRVVTCPEDEAPAIVALSWNTPQRRTVVVECDNRHWKDGRCNRECEALLQGMFPAPIPTTVVP
jgi:hypothetical protein